MDNNEIKEKTLNGVIWMFMERIGAQAVTFVVSLILARILLPENYGVVAIAQIFINFANIFVIDGLSAALIQKRKVSDIEYSTAFFTNLIFAIILYMIIFFISPLISDFYNDPFLTVILRVLSLRLPIGALNTIQRAYVSKNLLFKKFFFSTLIGTIISAAVGISLALLGFGTWAIVAQYLTNTIIDSIVLLFTVNWHPKFMFSFKVLHNMIGFGSKVLVSSFFNEFYLELRALIIGKKYGSADLAFYNRGKQFPQLFYANIVSAITSVIFPVMSLNNENKNDLKRGLERSIEISSYVLFPIMLGLAITANSIVLILLTDKWTECIPYLQLYCICYAILPMQSIIEQLYKAIGKAEILIKLFFIEKTIGIIIILITMLHSVWAIALGMLLTSIICSIIHIIPLKKEINFTFTDLIKCIQEPFLFSIFMVICVSIVQFIQGPLIVTLILQFIIGFFAYILISVVCKSKSFIYLVDILCSKTHFHIFSRIKEKLRS